MKIMVLVIMICQLVQLAIIAVNAIITQVQHGRFMNRVLETPTQEDIEEKLKAIADENDMVFIDVDKIESEE